MNAIKKYTQEIANYVFNDMTPEEKRKFERVLIDNKVLADEVTRQIKIHRDLKGILALEKAMNDPHFEEADIQVKEFLSKSNKFDRSVSDTGIIKSKFLSKKTNLTLAAAIIILLSIGTALVLNPYQKNLYQHYYKPFNSTSFTVRSNNSNASIIYQGIENYNNANYIEAIETFLQINGNQELPAEASFVLGLAYLANQDYTNARITMEQHLNEYSLCTPEVEWYLGLCYMKLGDTIKATEYISPCSEFDGKFGRNAKKLLKRLEKAIE